VVFQVYIFIVFIFSRLFGSLPGMLFHVKHEPFEVFPLRVADVDGMVWALCELMEYSDASARLGGGAEDRQTEHLFGDQL
jgi:hypothetical protein